MERPITEMNQDYIDRAKDYINSIYPEELQPNWEAIETITTGIAKGGKNYNVLIWQGEQYWHIGQLYI
jgi:hypothetical protein